MSFHEIVNSTATIPYDMNDNFLHVAQSSITPKTGPMLAETTSTINIGSSTNRWNKGNIGGGIFTDAITIASNRTLVQIASIELSTTTSQIDITGLNGDFDYNYFIVASFNTSSVAVDNIRLWINNDSNTSNYYSIDFTANDSSIFNYAYIGGLGPSQNTKNSFINFRAKTGNIRKLKSLLPYQSNNILLSFFAGEVVSIYGDTTDTVTSITFSPSVCNFETQTSIRIYKYGMD